MKKFLEKNMHWFALLALALGLMVVRFGMYVSNYATQTSLNPINTIETAAVTPRSIREGTAPHLHCAKWNKPLWKQCLHSSTSFRILAHNLSHTIWQSPREKPSVSRIIQTRHCGLLLEASTDKHTQRIPPAA